MPTPKEAGSRPITNKPHWRASWRQLGRLSPSLLPSVYTSMAIIYGKVTGIQYTENGIINDINKTGLLHCNRARVMSERIVLVLWLLVVCTQPQILDISVSTRLLDCSFYLHYLYPWIGLMLQAMNFTGVYEIFTSMYGKYIPPLEQSDYSICYSYSLNFFSRRGCVASSPGPSLCGRVSTVCTCIKLFVNFATRYYICVKIYGVTKQSKHTLV